MSTEKGVCAIIDFSLHSDLNNDQFSKDIESSLIKSFYTSSRLSTFWYTQGVINKDRKRFLIHHVNNFILSKNKNTPSRDFNSASYVLNRPQLDFTHLKNIYNYCSYYSFNTIYNPKFYPSTMDSYLFNEYSELLNYLTSVYSGLDHCLKCLCDNYQSKFNRLYDSFGLMADYCSNSFGGLECASFFVTLSLPDSYLNTHSLDQTIKSLKKFVKFAFPVSISNFDCGSDPYFTNRVHLHLLTAGARSGFYDINKYKIDYSKIYTMYKKIFGSDAYLFIEKCSDLKEDCAGAVSHYLSKFSVGSFTNHSSKDTASYYRGFKTSSLLSLNKAVKDLSISDYRNTILNDVLDLFDSINSSIFPGWFNSLSKKNKNLVNDYKNQVSKHDDFKRVFVKDSK